MGLHVAPFVVGRFVWSTPAWVFAVLCAGGRRVGSPAERNSWAILLAFLSRDTETATAIEAALMVDVGRGSYLAPLQEYVDPNDTDVVLAPVPPLEGWLDDFDMFEAVFVESFPSTAAFVAHVVTRFFEKMGAARSTARILHAQRARLHRLTGADHAAERGPDDDYDRDNAIAVGLDTDD